MIAMDYTPPPAIYAAMKPEAVHHKAPVCEPDVLCSVVQATYRLGWPHPVQEKEILSVVRRVSVKFKAPAVACAPTGTTIAQVDCGVAFRSGRSFAVRVKVWEDGSYRIRRVGR